MQIKVQLIILAVSAGIVVFTILVVAYFQIADFIKKDSYEYMTEMVFQIKKNISTNIDILDKLLNNVAYNSSVQEFMMEKDPYRHYKLFQQVDSICTNLQEIKNDIYDIVIISNIGEKYQLRGYNEKLNEIIKNIPVEESIYYTGTYLIRYPNLPDFDLNCFIVITNVYSVSMDKSPGEKIGIAALIINKNMLGFETNKEDIKSSARFYLTDRNDNLYSSNDNNNSIFDNIANTFENNKHKQINNRTIIINNESFVVYGENIDRIDGRIISAAPVSELFRDIRWVQQMTIVLFVIAIILLSIPFMLIISNILNPLNEFVNHIGSIRKGNLKELKQRVSLEGYEEIEIMAGEFNALLDEIDNLTHRLVKTSTKLYEAELEKKKAELEYLKSQINPHFLYNTLEVMKGCAVDENAFKTLEIAKCLGQIFRYSVKGADIVTLREEMEIAKSYIQIQQVRFNERFNVFYKYDDDVLNCNVPKMILQPIIENAVFHGLETKLEKGNLYIEAEINKSDDLNIWVMDDGSGMDEETLCVIRQRLEGDTGERENKDDITTKTIGIGITNVNNRLRLTYGENYGVSIDSREGEGTGVLLKIPARRDMFV